MNIKDAARLLNITGTVTPAEIKKAYRKAAYQYHPDRNPAGADMMKLINNAYEVLKDFEGAIPDYEAQATDYPEALNAALNSIIGLAKLDIEICGAWVWVSGNTKQHKEILKQVGFNLDSSVGHSYMLVFFIKFQYLQEKASSLTG